MTTTISNRGHLMTSDVFVAEVHPQDTDETEALALIALPCISCGELWCYIHDEHLAECDCISG